MTDDLKQWLSTYESGRVWLSKLHSQHTIRSYLSGFNRFCNWSSKNPDELLQLKIEGLQNVATSKEFQAELLLEKFISEGEYKPNIKKAARDAVVSFFKHNRRPLVEPQYVEIPEPKKRCPTIADILALEDVGNTARDKFLIWFLACCPFRLETLTLLKWKDLKPTNDPELPYMISVESSRLKGKGVGNRYRGLRQVCFVTWFAAKFLEKYKVELECSHYVVGPEEPLFVAYKKKPYIKGEKRKTTPLKDGTVETFFYNASFRAWHNLSEKVITPQDFRSFVQTALENANINANIISVVLGHKPRATGTIDSHYSDHRLDDIQQKIKTALPYLLPQFKTQESKISNLEVEVQGLTAQLNIIKQLNLHAVDSIESISSHELKVEGVVAGKPSSFSWKVRQ